MSITKRNPICKRKQLIAPKEVLVEMFGKARAQSQSRQHTCALHTQLSFKQCFIGCGLTFWSLLRLTLYVINDSSDSWVPLVLRNLPRASRIQW